MNINVETLGRTAQDLLKRARACADEKGVKALLVGGVVRDLLLGVPSLDLDIVIEGDAIAFARMLAGGRAKVLTHERFGTAVVTFPDGFAIDCVTARREVYAKPGALPDVTPGTIQDDLFRRDFTVNALAVSLNAKDLGTLVDEHGGVADLKKKNIRVLHAKSFQDDPTRIVRAARYAARFGFRLEPKTEKELCAAAAADAFSTVTPVRYFNEFRRILEEKDPVPALDLLKQWGALKYVPYGGIEKKRLKAALKWQDRFNVLVAPLEEKQVREILRSFNVRREDQKIILERI
ncbi:MAG: CCA tRNA nucleotidyltransferase [Candidatus Omnitrophica bacterium]|nr:CCA tRNA nucleotidyltransferase [Candidatus Omnitrophota bacterium]